MLTFAAAIFFLIISPGPGVLSAAGVSAAFGMRAGLRYVLGLMIGNAAVMLAVITGLAALILASPVIRTVLMVLSTAYLLYLAAKIAFAGAQVSFIAADREPGVLGGFLLQPINPKAYVVNTFLFANFPLYPDAYVTEVIVKAIVFNAIWLPLHILWCWFGASLRRLNLAPRQQRAINVGMAASMLVVVGLALIAGGVG
ncbi:LysE family translocator [Pseudaestuariivita atlantica]|uniref:Amino acid transporter LysE n=1 Tax=Pseudaestuariivita atlantica TaxID=1317121 RepID=A0A0L1JNB5_9RHOB|nr:LysE family translocator [Pseudaestuariivita atlantica]KNG93202.1 amino acid transporter LysE [Pseudaestuariivita atlantica]